MDLFKLTAACMHWGNQQWQQKPREEQAEANGTEHVEKVAKLLGLEIDSFVNGLLQYFGNTSRNIETNNIYKNKQLLKIN